MKIVKKTNKKLTNGREVSGMTTNFCFFTINVSRCIWIIDSGQSRLNASIKKAFRGIFSLSIKLYNNKVWSNFVS